jgi:hypothetical protein
VGPSRYDAVVYLMAILFGFAVTAAVAALQLAAVEICHGCHWCIARGAAMSREGWRATLRFPSLLVLPTFLMLPGIATATTVILSRWVDRPHEEQIVAVGSASVVLVLVPTLLTFRFALRFGAVMRIRPWAMRTPRKRKRSYSAAASTFFATVVAGTPSKCVSVAKAPGAHGGRPRTDGHELTPRLDHEPTRTCALGPILTTEPAPTQPSARHP